MILDLLNCKDLAAELNRTGSLVHDYYMLRPEELPLPEREDDERTSPVDRVLFRVAELLSVRGCQAAAIDSISCTVVIREGCDTCRMEVTSDHRSS